MKTSRAILCGWAVASFEAGLVLSASAHFAETPLFWAMALLAPVLVYGSLGWLASKLPLSGKLPWDLATLLGCVFVLHLRRQLYVGADGWAWLIAGVALTTLFWLGTRAERTNKASCAFSGLLIAYLVLRLRQFTHNDPQKLDERGWVSLFDYGLNLSNDWHWFVSFALILGLGFLLPRSQPKELNLLIRKTAAWLLLVPLVSAAYLHFSLQGGALKSPGPTVVAPDGSPNVILVSWDTVRADTLPLYGGGGLETPNLHSLAEQGHVFENWQSIAPITAPAHNSMLTGMYPPSHGLRDNGDTAPVLKTPRLPELFHNGGWSTGAFISARPVIGRDKGFSRGFQHFDDRAGETASLIGVMAGFSIRTVAICDRLFPAGLDSAAATTPGATTTNRAIEWIAGQTRPVFAWVHLFDAHDPRESSEEYLPFRAAALSGKNEGPHAVNPDCEESLVLQRGEVAFLDSQLGRLLESLELRDPGLSNTIVAVVSDHGECFGEGSDVPELFGKGGIKVLHAPSLYAATQHVVGVLRAPGSTAGTRSKTIASHIDLLPTLCELAGIQVPEGIQGRSLQPLTKGEALEDYPLYMEAYGLSREENRLMGYQEGEWKYVRSVSGKHEFLFSTKTGDAVNYFATEPARAAEMSAKLDELRASIPEVGRGVVEMGAAEQASLEALGYGGDSEETDY
ncbi:MAG: sulfatase-like hydrolase/transferase [Planctomycetota bacterium]|nr:sulfatase-like hydrolase/transferase [Planctomycetota bacterium]